MYFSDPFPGVVAVPTVEPRTLRCRDGEVGPKRPVDWERDRRQILHLPYDEVCRRFRTMARKCNLNVWDDPECGGFAGTRFKGGNWVEFVVYLFHDEGVEMDVKNWGDNYFAYCELVQLLNVEMGTDFGTIPTVRMPPMGVYTDDMPLLMDHFEHNSGLLFKCMALKTKTYPDMFLVGGSAVGLTLAAMRRPTDNEELEVHAHKWRFAALLVEMEPAPELVAAVAKELRGANIANAHVRRFYLRCAAALAKLPEYLEGIKNLVPLALAELEINEMAGSCRCAAEIVALCA